MINKLAGIAISLSLATFLVAAPQDTSAVPGGNQPAQTATGRTEQADCATGRTGKTGGKKHHGKHAGQSVRTGKIKKPQTKPGN